MRIDYRNNLYFKALYDLLNWRTKPKKRTMTIRVDRVYSSEKHTNSKIYIDNEFICYGLEDEFRKVKKFGETRIPKGTYKVTFRPFGGKHEHYLEKYGSDFHKGMLWIRNVPNFKYILIHVGNTDIDTHGCLLVGSKSDERKNFIGASVKAYKKFYPIVRDALLRGENVTITFNDLDKIKN